MYGWHQNEAHALIPRSPKLNLDRDLNVDSTDIPFHLRNMIDILKKEEEQGDSAVSLHCNISRQVCTFSTLKCIQA